MINFIATLPGWLLDHPLVLAALALPLLGAGYLALLSRSIDREDRRDWRRMR